MYVLVSGGPALKYEHPYLGQLLTPHTGNLIREDRLWAMDNAAFSNWHPEKFWKMLVKQRQIPGCLWAVVPDVVGDHIATLRRWHAWAWLVRSLGYNPAFVAQDGCTPAECPWRFMACLFLGGTNDYKLGPDARACVAEALRRGDIWVHMGRVNSHKRYLYARQIGCHSTDGTGWSRFFYPQIRRMPLAQPPLWIGDVINE